MKHITTVVITVLVLVVITPVTTIAQPINFGAKAGLNFANFGGDGASGWDTNSRIGLALGGYLEYPIANSLYFQPELLYTMKGASDKFIEDGTSYTLTFKYNYLEIPLLGKLAIDLDNSGLRPMLLAGISPAFRVSSNWHWKGGGENLQGKDDRLKSFDLGFVIGAGIGFSTGSGTGGAEIRYNMGLTSIDDTGDDILDFKNNVLMLMVSYQIGVLNR